MIHEDEPIEVLLIKVNDDQLTMNIQDQIVTVKSSINDTNNLSVYKGKVNGMIWSGLKYGNNYELLISGRRIIISAQKTCSEFSKESKNTILTAPVPGIVSRVLFDIGEKIKAGDTVAIIEAMKMENRICSNMNGIVKKILCKQSEIVKADQAIAVLDHKVA